VATKGDEDIRGLWRFVWQAILPAGGRFRPPFSMRDEFLGLQ